MYVTTFFQRFPFLFLFSLAKLEMIPKKREKKCNKHQEMNTCCPLYYSNLKKNKSERKRNKRSKNKYCFIFYTISTVYIKIRDIYIKNIHFGITYFLSTFLFFLNISFWIFFYWLLKTLPNNRFTVRFLLLHWHYSHHSYSNQSW